MLTCYAHSLEGRLPNEWEPLADHLKRVAELAAKFAKKFEATEWARHAGLWHDLGKYSEEFQAYLFKENGLEAHLEQYKGRVNHSSAGAQHAAQIFTELGQSEAGRILAYCIAGHHAGLADADHGRSGLNQRLKENIPDWSATPVEMLAATKLGPPALTLTHGDIPRAAFQISLFCRMLFSCLVDADFLATEEFMSRDRSRARPQPPPPMEVLENALNEHLEALTVKTDRNVVQEMRQEILAACRNAADRQPGLFSLTVPTGGGKTLSSLAFALRHAQQHHLERVIYAIPFTSIIEQTASVFRNVFDDLGEQIVLEHHSNLDPDENGESKTSRIAAENWDSPLIVTTNVQLFESLFASRTS
jgi:CRISPR-associated endonuclease/helicase Cas3